MTSIRRLGPGLFSPLSRTSLDTETRPVGPTAPQEPLQPVEKLRRGYSPESDFQAEGADGVDASFFEPSGSDVDGGGSSLPDSKLLRAFSGVSDFEAAPPRYAQMLGSQFPSSTPSGMGALDGWGRGASARPAVDSGALDPTDILSPDAAAWELQNLDTSTPTIDDPEDLLFMLDPPGSAGPADPRMQLGLDEAQPGYPMDDVFQLDAADLPPVTLRPPEEAQGASPAAEDAFFADPNDVENAEPGVADAAMSGVLASLTANPAAASVQLSSALATQGVNAVSDAMEIQTDAKHLEQGHLLGQPPSAAQLASLGSPTPEDLTADVSDVPVISEDEPARG